jgi:hypothetical protein
MSKKVTITYTRENLNTPWFWQALSESRSTADRDFIVEHSDRIQQAAHVAGQGLKNIITFTFSDDEIHQEWVTMVQSNVSSTVTEYCESNNITIDVVTEDI